MSPRTEQIVYLTVLVGLMASLGLAISEHAKPVPPAGAHSRLERP